MKRKKAEPMTSPTREARKKSQHSRIIPEEMLNSGTNRKYTKITGNEISQSKQQPPRPHDTTDGEMDETRQGH